jgi:hypothetical protein
MSVSWWVFSFFGVWDDAVGEMIVYGGGSTSSEKQFNSGQGRSLVNKSSRNGKKYILG